MRKKTKTQAEKDHSRLVSTLGLLSKLVVELVPILEGLMKEEKDLKASLDSLTAAVNSLQTAIAGLPGPVDLTADVAVVDSLKAQVDGIAAGLPGATPTPAPAGPAAPTTPAAA
jgi:hypothetical protein